MAVNNIYPRARLVFNSKVAITLKAAGNTNTILMVCTLPENYSYRLDSAFISFSAPASTELSQLEDLGESRISFEGVNTVIMNLKSEGLTSHVDVGGSVKVWTLSKAFREVLTQPRDKGVSPPRVSQSFLIYDNDGVNETVALENNTYISYLMYDIDQALDVIVNAPLPVSI